MNTEQIIETAIQGHASTRDAIRWAVQQEREACAKLCQDIAMKLDKACDGADKDEITSLQSIAWQIRVCAAAIRARGNE